MTYKIQMHLEKKSYSPCFVIVLILYEKFFFFWGLYLNFFTSQLRLSLVRVINDIHTDELHLKLFFCFPLHSRLTVAHTSLLGSVISFKNYLEFSQQDFKTNFPSFWIKFVLHFPQYEVSHDNIQTSGCWKQSYRSDKFEIIFSSPRFFQKMDEQIQLY